MRFMPHRPLLILALWLASSLAWADADASGPTLRSLPPAHLQPEALPPLELPPPLIPTPQGRPYSSYSHRVILLSVGSRVAFGSDDPSACADWLIAHGALRLNPSERSSLIFETPQGDLTPQDPAFDAWIDAHRSAESRQLRLIGITIAGPQLLLSTTSAPAIRRRLFELGADQLPEDARDAGFELHFPDGSSLAGSALKAWMRQAP